MTTNFFLRKSDKTEGPKNYKLSDPTLEFDSIKVFPSQLVKNLGVTMDLDLSFECHSKNITKIAFFHLLNIAKLRLFL